jgi:hypothetical protein
MKHTHRDSHGKFTTDPDTTLGWRVAITVAVIGLALLFVWAVTTTPG